MLGFCAHRAHPGFVCARHTFVRGRQKGNFYGFFLEANVCLWSLALPSSEYLLNFCLKKDGKRKTGISASGQTLRRARLKSPGFRGDAGYWHPPTPPTHTGGWVPRWTPGWKVNWPIWDLASELFSGNFLGPESSLSFSSLWKIVSWCVSGHS